MLRAVGPFLAASFKKLAHRRKIVSVSLFYKQKMFTLKGVDQNWFNWFYSLILEGGLLLISIDCMIFLSPFLDGQTCME